MPPKAILSYLILQAASNDLVGYRRQKKEGEGVARPSLKLLEVQSGSSLSRTSFIAAQKALPSYQTAD